MVLALGYKAFLQFHRQEMIFEMYPSEVLHQSRTVYENNVHVPLLAFGAKPCT